MKLLYLVFALVGWLSLFTPGLQAHPLDVSKTEMVFPIEEEGVEEYEIEFSTYIPWTGAQYLIAQEVDTTATPSASLLRKHLDTYADYFDAHFIVVNEAEECKMQNLSIPEQTESQVLLGSGLQINGSFVCPTPLGSMLIHNSFFIEIFPLQTNVLTLYEGSKDVTIKGALLTQKEQELYYNYLDETDQGESVIASADQQSKLGSEQLGEQFLNIGQTSILMAMGLTFLMGLLHTLEAGHSKAILAALVVNRGVKLKQGLAYATVFTATHVADILLMGGILLIANSFVDVFELMPFLQVASLYSLLLIAFYLLVKQLAEILKKYLLPKINAEKKNHGHDHHHSHELSTNISFRQQLSLGFVTGLAPCLFGWSIFMLIVSTENVWSVFPVILSFGGGIFVALALVAILITKLKGGVFNKFSWIGDWSPLFSALLLFGFAAWQVF